MFPLLAALVPMVSAAAPAVAAGAAAATGAAATGAAATGAAAAAAAPTVAAGAGAGAGSIIPAAAAAAPALSGGAPAAASSAASSVPKCVGCVWWCGAVAGVQNFQKGARTFMETPTGKTLQKMSSEGGDGPPPPQPLQIPNLYAGPSGNPPASIGEENPERRRRLDLLRGL